MPSGSGKSVINAISTTSSNPTFTGTAACFTASFIGTAASHTHTFTPQGSVGIGNTTVTGTVV